MFSNRVFCWLAYYKVYSKTSIIERKRESYKWISSILKKIVFFMWSIKLKLIKLILVNEGYK